MKPWTVTISKLKSDDGFWHLQGHYNVGDTLEIDLDSRGMQKFINRPTGIEFECEIVNTVRPLPGSVKTFFPTELLEIEVFEL